MEVDDQDQRLQMLEAQVHQLTARQASLETTVQDNHQQNTAQVQSLQQQMKVQLDLQTHQMQSMLTDQMAGIEHILAKKPRTERQLEGPVPLPTARVTSGRPRSFRAFLTFLLVLTTCRIGEARVPGPDNCTWKLGCCNPSGLQAMRFI